MIENWLPAWSDPYYRRYLYVVAGLLAVYGVVLALLRMTRRESPAVQHAWTAYRSWLVMAPSIFLAMGLGRVVFIIAIGLLSIFCVKEFARATGLYPDWGFVGVVYAGVAAFCGVALARWYGVFMALPIYALAVVFMVPAFRNQYDGMVQKVGLSTVALVYLGWFPLHLAFMANHRQWCAYLLFLIMGTELNDAGAYLCGRLFGRHPLISNISPKKTVEGALGAMLITAVFVWAVRPWLPGFTPFTLVMSGLILWIGGTMGDLVISFVKRDIGIKDMGTLIPGHGGLLDRFDSLIFTAPLFFHLVRRYVGPAGGIP
jgi:phosphatidate cytidylyltransferase